MLDRRATTPNSPASSSCSHLPVGPRNLAPQRPDSGSSLQSRMLRGRTRLHTVSPRRGGGCSGAGGKSLFWRATARALTRQLHTRELAALHSGAALLGSAPRGINQVAHAP